MTPERPVGVTEASCVDCVRNAGRIEHAKQLADGMRIAKIACTAGRLAGLPLPYMIGMPPEVVSKAEMQALQSFELLTSASLAKGPDGVERATTKGAKVATGKSYKALRQMISTKCDDKELMYCGMQKVRANDGTIEFVSPESTEKFKAEGSKCLVWNHLEQPLHQRARLGAGPSCTGPDHGHHGSEQVQRL